MGRREKLRQEMLNDIKTVARQQMTENGTAAISLSAIARSLEVSQPALYRYYASRDELVTALIVDAYNSLADAMEAADQGLPEQAYGKRLMAVIQANRDWALQNPLDFQLIYGNPIPGYHAPGDVTSLAAQRGFAVILRILGEALRAGALKPSPEQTRDAQQLKISLPALEDGQIHPVVLYFGIKGWTQTHGMITLELFNHTRALLPDPGLFYRLEVEELLRSAGLEP